ncbi:MFS transporter [Candidatus Gracilibacteria bacterium]|nr:MFS transporter [Candidatus Gracilibacteria bacterium]RKW24490.1 MAG: MFS transporter [Candidatus Gracilibacteria bacterium]
MVNFVGIQPNAKDIKLRNLLIVGAFTGFVTIIFHFTVVFFFGLILDSIFLVGLFLAVGNVVSLIFDIPIGVLQKYIKPKTSMVIGAIIMLIACLIFFKFIYLEGLTGALLPEGKVFNYLGKFLDSFTNIFLLALAAGLYGIQSEIFGVTSYSYILDNTGPSEYAKYLSRYNIFTGAGSMLGLVFSGLLLALNIKLAIIIFIVVIALFIIFLMKYFNNSTDTITLNNIKKLKIDSFKLDLGKKAQKISQTISTKNLMDLAKKTKIIFIKPTEPKNKIDYKEVYDITVLNFQRFIKVIFKIPRNLMILWLFFILMQFSFWDTFVATFFVDYIKEISEIDSGNVILQETSWLISGYVWLGIIAIPGFLLQDPFITLSKKFGEFNVLMLGTFISGLSLVLFGVYSHNFTMILILGIINSVGYAAVIGVGQGLFSERYNVLYAIKNNLKQIDSTVSAAPLKIILNLANVVGLLFGSLIVSKMGFTYFFIIFGGLLLGLFLYSVFAYKKINDSGKEGDGLFADGDAGQAEVDEFDGEVFKG